MGSAPQRSISMQRDLNPRSPQISSCELAVAVDQVPTIELCSKSPLRRAGMNTNSSVGNMQMSASPSQQVVANSSGPECEKSSKAGIDLQSYTTEMTLNVGHSDNDSASRGRISMQSTVKSFSLLDTIVRIRSQNLITGRDYTILSVWGHMFTAIINIVVLGSLYGVAVTNTILMSPICDKVIAITCISMGFCYTATHILLSVGYCRLNHDKPLIRTRGTQYMTIMLTCTTSAILLQFILTMAELGAFAMDFWVFVVLEAGKHFAWMVFLGCQVARQRLLYKIFVKDVYRVGATNMRNALTVVVLWALIGSGSTAAIAFLQPTVHWWTIMFVNIIISVQVILWALCYYSWKSRHISKAFSDWVDNLLAASNTILIPTTYLILRITIWNTGPPSFDNPPSINAILLNVFLVFGDVSLCVVQLFGKLAYIQYSGLKVAVELDPKMLFVAALRARSTEAIKISNAACLPSRVPQAFNLISCTDVNEYGPSAISCNSR